MFMKALRLAALFIVLLIGSCREDVVEPIQMIANGDMESGSASPGSWWYPDTSGDYKAEWSSEASHSPARSLKLSTEIQRADRFSFWAQSKCSDIPRGKTVALKVMIKGELIGTGVSVAIRCDGATPNAAALQFMTTQGNTAITGTFDWKEYSIEIGQVEQATSCITVYLVYLPQTSGKVYFDDVSLTHF
jgi:hypothetical protein